MILRSCCGSFSFSESPRSISSALLEGDVKLAFIILVANLYNINTSSLPSLAFSHCFAPRPFTQSLQVLVFFSKVAHHVFQVNFLPFVREGLRFHPLYSPCGDVGMVAQLRLLFCLSYYWVYLVDVFISFVSVEVAVRYFWPFLQFFTVALFLVHDCLLIRNL